MKTQRQIWDSLWAKPITKAALIAYLELTKNYRGEYGQICRARADAISARFRIADLVLQWRNASA